MKKFQAWTSEEDQMLIRFHKQASCFQRWKFISKKLKEHGILKTQFQCRDRFVNHVDPSLKHGRLSNDQIAQLFALYDEYGPCWSFFQTKIIGRSQSLLKNKFYSTIRSLLRHFIKFSRKRNWKSAKIKPSTLSSKFITDLYEGKKEFVQAKNILRNCMKNINYVFETSILQKYIKNINPEVIDSLINTISKNTIPSKKSSIAKAKLESQQNLDKFQQEEQQDGQSAGSADLQSKNCINSQDKENQQDFQIKGVDFSSNRVQNVLFVAPQTYWNPFPQDYPYNVCYFYL